MSKQEQQVTPPTPEAPAEKPTETERQEIDWKAQARKWEARAKENRDTAKANEAAARELEVIKQEQMTELEKAQQAAQEAAKRADLLELERDRLAVLAKYQIPEEYASLVDEGDLDKKAQLVQQLVATDKQAVKGRAFETATKPIPRSMSDVTVEDQLKDAIKRGDKQAEMRLKLLQLNTNN